MEQPHNIDDDYISILVNSGFFNTNEAQPMMEKFEELTVLSQYSKNYCLVIKAKKYGKWHLIKRLKPEYANNSFYSSLLEKEFELAYNLDHPNIAKTISKAYDNSGMFIVIEYIDGITLRELMETKDLSKNLLLVDKLINETNSALGYIHSKQIIHRDLKPTNILITHNGNNVKIIDFGLSDTDAYYAMKDPAGTKKYSAPEQFDSKNTVNHKADYFALGIIIKEIFTKTNYTRKIPLKYRKIIKGCTNPNIDKRFSFDEVNKLMSKTSNKRWVYTALVTAVIVLYIAANYLFTPHSASKLTNNQEFLERFKSNKLSEQEVIAKSADLGYSWIDSLNSKVPDFAQEPDYNKIGGWLNIFKYDDNGGSVSKWIKLENELKSNPVLYEKCKSAYLKSNAKANLIFLHQILDSKIHRLIYINNDAFYKFSTGEQMHRLMKYQTIIDSTLILSLQGNKKLSETYRQKILEYYNRDINLIR